MKMRDYSNMIRGELRKKTLIELLTLKTKLLMLNMILNEEIYLKQDWEGRK